MSTTELDRQLHQSVLKRERLKEQKRRAEEPEKEYVNIGSGGEMTKQKIHEILASDRRMYYRTEDLNDKLYIHYKGWSKLQNLEGFTGLKVLYGECNAFSTISGLETCTNLRSLFLQENCIKEISGLETCHSLWNLNLSSNFIEKIEGLAHIKTLNTLTIAKNKIGFNGAEDLEHLVDSTISSLDIQDNRISDVDILPDVLMRMKELRVLYLKGNECCKRIPNYRKTTTACLKDLKYLDDRPVFEEDRRAAEAFNRGGLEEERAERKKMREEKSEAHRRNMEAFQKMIENSRAEKRERDAMRVEDKYTDDTDPVESPEKKMARQRREWEEANPELLKDDVKEMCEKKLAQEKETERREGKASMDTSTSAAASSLNTLDGDTGPLGLHSCPDPKPQDMQSGGIGAEMGEDKKKKKVDNRKLVYEDIWDDGPSPWQRSVPNPELPTTPQLGEDFVPWAAPQNGASEKPKELTEEEITRRAVERRKQVQGSSAPRGMDKFLESRAQELADEEEQAMKEIAGADDFKPSWHSRQQEKIHETMRKLNYGQDVAKPSAQASTETKENTEPPKKQHVFAPPSRVAHATPPPAPQNELDEMD
jgi:dynein assembly factor 1